MRNALNSSIAAYAALFLTWSSAAKCQATMAWPKPVILTVAFPAGGVTDGIARRLAIEIGRNIGQDIVVENKGGAGGNLGAQSVARSAPDGRALLFVSAGPAAINKLIYKNMQIDPEVDLAPIVLVGLIPQIIVTKRQLPIQTLQDFVDYGKKNPGQLSIGNSGVGTSAHITAVLFALQTGIDVVHVPYRGTAPLTTDLLGGQIDAGFPGFFPQTSELKMLAVTSKARLDALPDVPTVTETGVTNLVAGLWMGLMGPAGLPDPMIKRINKIVNDYLRTGEAQKLASTFGMRVMGGSPEEMREYVRSEIKRFEPIIQNSGISLN